MRALLAVVLAIAGSHAIAQDVNPTPKMSVKIDKSSVKANSVVKGTITLTFAPEYHGYQNPPSDKFQLPVSLKSVSGGFKVVKVNYPKGVEKMVAGSDKPSGVYEGEIQIPFEIRAPKKLGKTPVAFTVFFQQCNAENCYPPGDVISKVVVTVTK